jgi:peptidoglycan hydrolase-like protein with peptidoglycan-binding domain
MNILEKDNYVYSYARQQQILSKLGFYEGKIDGFWGPKTVAAKKEFERSQDFKPCVPNYGLPFTLSSPLPSCLFPSSDGLLHLHDVPDSDLPQVDPMIDTYLTTRDKKEQIRQKASVKEGENQVFPSDVTNRRYTEVDLSQKVSNTLAALAP